MNKEQIIKSLAELRKNEKRKFEQTVDLIINLKNFDIKRESVNIFVSLPHKVKDKKVFGFLTRKSSVIDSVTKAEIDSYKDKKKAKGLVRENDFFVAHASLMPTIATSIGRFLGPSGKMPTPALGILTDDSDNAIKAIVQKINSVVRVKTKEPSIKVAAAREGMKDEEIAENILAVYNAVIGALKNNKENVRSVMVKLTMSKPVKIE